MPAIVIKDYRWRQTEKRIIIYVPLKGRPKNMDLLAINRYVKISFPPFILELFLWENVLEEESKCTLTDTEAIFSLHKAHIASDWPSLEMEDINKEQKYDFRNRVLKRIRNILENHTKSRKEKCQHLKKEATKVQINLNTDTLNKIEVLRDSHRKAAMQDLQNWRLNAEIPILEDISGKVQKNRNAYRFPLKWLKDDLDIVQFWEIDQKREINEEIRKKQIDESVIEKLKEEPIVEENLKEGLVLQEKLKKELIIEKNTKKILIMEENLKEKSIIVGTLKKELNIEENLKKGLTVKEYPKTKAINKTNLKEDTVLNENIQEKVNVLGIKQIKTLSKNSKLKKSFGYSENSESDHEMESSILASSANLLIKEMDQKFLRKFYTKMKKQTSSQDLIDKVLKDQYSRMNKIFDEPAKTIPLPRKSGTINITFSERIFPTPARESSLVKEQEWLSKQAEARRKTGFIVENLRPEEQDPQWLKDKGDEFFKAGNYLAAISAYTHGIKISNKMAALYVNRSAAHYALGNYYRCIEDCTKVLELMELKCENNRLSRVRCHVRRGAAFCKLSAPQHGIPELETALKLYPNNESIKRDLHAARQYFVIKE